MQHIGKLDDAPDDGPTPTPSRPRWVVPVGVAALAAAAIVVVTTNDPSSPSARTTATSTTAASAAPNGSASTTAAAPTTVASSAVGAQSSGRMRAGDVPRYVVDLPRAFRPDRADVFTPLPVTDDLSAHGVLSQQWATPGATQTTGRWIVINAYPGSGGARWSSASYRTEKYGNDVAVTPPTSATSPTVLTYALGSTLIRVESFGFALDELAEVLLAVAPSTSSDVPRGIEVRPTGFSGMELRYSGAYDWRQSLIGTTQSDVVATRSYDRQYGWIEVTVGAPVTDRDALLPFLIGAPTPFLSADGSLGVAGTPPQWWDAASVAQWVDPNGWMVTIRSSLDVSEVVALAEQARPATESEWTDLQATVQVVRDLPAGSTSQGRVTDGSLTDGSYWRMSLARQTSISGATFVWRLVVQNSDGTNVNEVAATAAGGALVSSVVFNGLTVVTATMPGDFPSGAVLRVDRPGLDPITVLLQAPQPDFSVFAAAIGFEDASAFVATVIAADGSVLATWPAPPVG